MVNRIVRFVAVTFGALTAVSAAHATLSITTQANSVRNDVVSETGPIVDLNTGVGVSAFALVDYGIVQVATGASIGSPGSRLANASGQWEDRVVVDSPVAAGFMNVRLDVRYALATESVVPPNNDANFTFDFFGGTADDFASFNFDQAIEGNDTVPAARLLPVVSIPWLSGQGFQIRARSRCFGQLSLAGSSICLSDNSAYWGGILSVTDADGAIIEDWSITSESGTDWRQSFVPPAAVIPEPASWAMLIAGFGLIGAVARRRGAGARVAGA